MLEARRIHQNASVRGRGQSIVAGIPLYYSHTACMCAMAWYRGITSNPSCWCMYTVLQKLSRINNCIEEPKHKDN